MRTAYRWKDDFPRTAALLFSMLGLFLRWRKLDGRELWHDEFTQMWFMGGSFQELIQGIRKTEFCALAGDFLLTYPFFKLAPYNKHVLAIPHFMATILGFVLLQRLCRGVFKTWGAYVVTFALVCFNQNLIFHAGEVRTYAVLPTLALAVHLCLPRLFSPDPDTPEWKRWVAGFFLTGVALFHLYGVFMIFFPLLYHGVVAAREGRRPSRVVMGIAKYAWPGALMAAPLWLYCVFGPRLDPDRFPSGIFDYIPDPRQNALGFAKGIFGNLAGYRPLYPFLLGLAWPFLIVRNPDRFRQLAFLALNILAPIGMIFLIDVKEDYFFVQRQFIWVMPLFAFYLGWTWDTAFQHIRIFAARRWELCARLPAVSSTAP